MLEFLDHHREKGFADSPAFVRGKQGQDNYLSGIPISKAVANHLTIHAGHKARTTAVSDTCTPGLGSDTECT